MSFDASESDNAEFDAVRAASDARARYGRLDAQLAAAEAIAQARRSEQDELQRQLRVEEADVRKLERVTPTRLWAVMRGQAEERLAVERAEAQAAAYAVAAAQSRSEQAAGEAARIRAERDGLGDVDRAYATALAGYEQRLRAAGGDAGAELADIAAATGAAAAEQREIAEAQAALGVAVGALDDATEKLASAGGWATYDTFFGGGMIADLAKHSRISEATASFGHVNRALERLSTELADIDAPALQGVEISEMLTVFDVLFDNVFADWMVRDRIAQARDRADDLRHRLAQLDAYLSRRSDDVAGRLGELARRREALLTAESRA